MVGLILCVIGLILLAGIVVCRVLQNRELSSDKRIAFADMTPSQRVEWTAILRTLVRTRRLPADRRSRDLVRWFAPGLDFALRRRWFWIPLEVLALGLISTILWDVQIPTGAPSILPLMLLVPPLVATCVAVGGSIYALRLIAFIRRVSIEKPWTGESAPEW
jgi:hypothetical protein